MRNPRNNVCRLRQYATVSARRKSAQATIARAAAVGLPDVRTIPGPERLRPPAARQNPCVGPESGICRRPAWIAGRMALVSGVLVVCLPRVERGTFSSGG